MAVKFLNGISVDGSLNLHSDDIPDLGAGKITSGTLSVDRIPNLSGVYQPAGEYLTLETANTTFQPIGNYLTSVPSEYLTQTEGDARYLKLTGGTLTGDLLVGATDKTSDTVVRSLADQSYKAGFEAYGNGQGTGYFYAGQSSSYGGGFSYNGDGSPGFISGETADNITFFRRQAGTDTEVFHYAYSNNDVYFNGAVVASGSNSNNWNTAYGWGDHAAANYLTSLPSHNHDTLYDAAGSAAAVNTALSEEIGNVSSAVSTNTTEISNNRTAITGLGTSKQDAGNYFTDGDTVINMTNNDGFVYDDATNKMYVKLDGTNRELYHTANLDTGTFVSKSGGTMTGDLVVPNVDVTTQVTIGPWAVRHNTESGRLEFVLS